MNYYLVIDTETSGLPDFRRPADAPGQARLAEFGMIRLDADGKYLARCQTYIRPEGWSMSAAATAVNGLTDAFLMNHGQAVEPLMRAWYAELDAGDTTIVGFNTPFDLKVLRGELRRLGLSDLYQKTRSRDLMRIMTPVCKLPGPRGIKWPTLAEACSYFGIECRHQHGAAWDTLYTAKLFRRCCREGLL